MFSILITFDVSAEYQYEYSKLELTIKQLIPGISSITYLPNHSEAHTHLAKYQPDILLSDLNFIIKYGIQNLRAVCPGLKIIVSTPDDRIENAIQCYNQGTFRYLLQPNLLTNLLTAIQDCVQQIEREKERESMQINRSRFIDSMLWDRVLFELVSQPSSFHQCIDALSDYPFPFQKMQTATVVTMSIGGIHEIPPQDQPSVCLQTKRFLQNLCGEYGVVFQSPLFRAAQYSIIFGKFPSSPRWSRQRLMDVLRQQAEHFTEEQPFSLKIGVGSSVDRLEDLTTSYSRAFDAMLLSFPFLNTKLVDCEQPTAKNQRLSLPPQTIEHLVGAKDRPAVFELQLDYLISHFNAQETLLWSQLQTVAIQILNALDKQAVPKVSTGLSKIMTLSDFRSFVLSLLKMPDRQSTKKSSLIEKVKYLIHNQYNDPEISLQSIAQTTFTSPSYLSTIFKKEMGVSFVEYLAMVRVDKAKELCAKKDLKISEIAHRIGYQDSSYFSYCFKKIVGSSPSEYQKKLTE